ncbi:type VI secretion system tip protein TssI/VgrG [Pelagibaculum spongiae]|uniref:Uncharacterized protein n=1 Tax=Pelagibaculum spongiae TaxID=2080658 RepID=A0A2V1GRR5_9GAMM|nr:type VI secretion system tip protein TssI/VgrG [Pelagibaculum spongiae]PVZ67691.1 hypothetical protein DC094_14750 [Pelagibaculum spongiae]
MPEYDSHFKVISAEAGTFEIIKIEYEEELGQPFVLQLDLVEVIAETDTGPEDIVTPDAIVGSSFSLETKLAQDNKRQFNGIVTNFVFDGYDRNFIYYKARVEPTFSLLRQISDCRIFQELPVDKIIEDVLGEIGVSCDLSGISGSYSEQEVVVQYNENTFDFISRLMQENGIFYYWEHTDSDHMMMLCDDATSFSASTLFDGPVSFYKGTLNRFPEMDSENLPEFSWPEKKSDNQQFSADQYGSQDLGIPSGYYVATGALIQGQAEKNHANFLEEDSSEKIFSLKSVGRHTSAGFASISQNPIETATPIESVEVAVLEFTPEFSGEGFYEANLQALDEETSTVFAKVRTEALAVDQSKYIGEGTVCSMEVGTTFEMSDHQIAVFNQEYQVNSIHLIIVDPLDVEGWNAARVGKAIYRSRFSLQASGTAFRSVYTTPRPKISGPQLAKVVGPSSDDIFTDKFGRIKVEFFWDKESEGDDTAFCYIPVSQSWAGNGFGSQFIPRIGSTVVVNFMDGNPDRPICTGCVYNDVDKPPFALPDEMNKSGFRSKSTPDGGTEDFNEIMFDDTAGEEKLSITAQFDYETKVKNNMKLEVAKETEFKLTDKVAGKCEAAVTLEFEDTYDAKYAAAVSLECKDAYTLEAKEVAVTGKSEIAFDVGGSKFAMSSSDIKMESGPAKIEMGSSGIKMECAGAKFELGSSGFKLVFGSTKIAGTATNIDILSPVKLNMKGTLASLEANGMLKIKGALVKMESAGPLMCKGMPIMLN